jgi:hypothetical protein
MPVIATFKTPPKSTKFGGISWRVSDDDDKVLILNGVNVNTIGTGFSGNKDLISFKITDAINYIGDGAFYGCSNLTSFEISSSEDTPIQRIGGSAFQDCTSLTSFIVSTSVYTIAPAAFQLCTGLKSIVFNNVINDIGQYAFYACINLKSAHISGTANKIGELCFAACYALTSLVLPDKVTDLGRACLYDCRELQTFNLPEGVTNLGGACFSRCRKLKNINMPNVKFIGPSCFEFTALTKIIIPEGVTSLPLRCFFVVAGLTEIILADSIESIGGGCFYECNELVLNSLPKYIKRTEGGAFSRRFNVSTFPDSLTYAGGFQDTAVSLSDLSKLNFKTLLPFFFANCHNITSMILPDSVTEIGASAFQSASNLKSVNFPSNLIKLNDNSLVGTSITAAIIPDGTTSIGEACFFNTPLINLHLPYTCTTLYRATFALTLLSNVTIPYGMSSLPNSVFEESSQMTSIVLPNAVTFIGVNCFQMCIKLRYLNIPYGISSIGPIFGTESHKLQSMTLSVVNIPSSVTSMNFNDIPPSVQLINTDSTNSYIYENKGNFNVVFIILQSI